MPAKEKVSVILTLDSKGFVTAIKSPTGDLQKMEARFRGAKGESKELLGAMRGLNRVMGPLAAKSQRNATAWGVFRQNIKGMGAMIDALNRRAETLAKGKGIAAFATQVNRQFRTAQTTIRAARQIQADRRQLGSGAAVVKRMGREITKLSKTIRQYQYFTASARQQTKGFASAKREATIAERKNAGQLVTLGQRLRAYISNMRRSRVATRRFSGELGRIRNTFKNVLIGFGAYFSIRSIARMIGSLRDFLSVLEQTRLGVAETLSVSGRFFSRLSGKELPMAQQIGLAFFEANRAVDILVEKSISLGVPLQSLTEAFTVTAGAARSAGVSLSMSLNIISNLAILAQRIHIPFNILARDVRDIFTGLNVQRTVLGNLLGLQTAQVQELRRQGELGGFLTEKLKIVGVTARKNLETFQGISTAIRNSIQALTLRVGVGAFARLRETLREVLIYLEGMRNSPELMHRLAKGITDAADAAARLGLMLFKVVKYLPQIAAGYVGLRAGALIGGIVGTAVGFPGLGTLLGSTGGAAIGASVGPQIAKSLIKELSNAEKWQDVARALTKAILSALRPVVMEIPNMLADIGESVGRIIAPQVYGGLFSPRKLHSFLLETGAIIAEGFWNQVKSLIPGLGASAPSAPTPRPGGVRTPLFNLLTGEERAAVLERHPELAPKVLRAVDEVRLQNAVTVAVRNISAAIMRATAAGRIPSAAPVQTRLAAGLTPSQQLQVLRGASIPIIEPGTTFATGVRPRKTGEVRFRQTLPAETAFAQLATVAESIGEPVSEKGLAAKKRRLAAVARISDQVSVILSRSAEATKAMEAGEQNLLKLRAQNAAAQAQVLAQQIKTTGNLSLLSDYQRALVNARATELEQQRKKLELQLEITQGAKLVPEIKEKGLAILKESLALHDKIAKAELHQKILAAERQGLERLIVGTLTRQLALTDRRQRAEERAVKAVERIHRAEQRLAAFRGSSFREQMHFLRLQQAAQREALAVRIRGLSEQIAAVRAKIPVAQAQFPRLVAGGLSPEEAERTILGRQAVLQDRIVELEERRKRATSETTALLVEQKLAVEQLRLSLDQLGALVRRGLGRAFADIFLRRGGLAKTMQRAGQEMGAQLMQKMIDETLKRKVFLDTSLERNFITDLPKMLAKGGEKGGSGFGQGFMGGLFGRRAPRTGPTRGVPGVNMSGTVPGGGIPGVNMSVPGMAGAQAGGGGFLSGLGSALGVGFAAFGIGQTGASMLGFGKKTSLGAGAGAAAGVMIGSIIPGIGTVIGGLIGAVAGGLISALFGGRHSARHLLRKAFQKAFEETFGTQPIITDMTPGSRILPAGFLATAPFAGLALAGGPLAAEARKGRGFSATETAARTRFGLLANMRALGLSAEDAAVQIRKFVRAYSGGDLDKALISLAKLRTEGKLTGASLQNAITGIVESTNGLPVGIDAARLALAALDEDGTVHIERLKRALDAAKALFGSLPGVIESGLRGANLGAMGGKLADTVSGSFISQLAKQLITKGALARVFTQVTANVSDAAEAFAVGDEAAGRAALAKARAAFLTARRGLMKSVGPLIPEVQGFAAGLGSPITGAGFIYPTAIPSFQTPTITRTPGPFGAPRLGTFHGGETVRSPGQEDKLQETMNDVRSILAGIAEAMSDERGRPIVVQIGGMRATLSIDGKQLATELRSQYPSVPKPRLGIVPPS